MSRYTELPKGTQAEVDRFVNHLAATRGDDAVTQEILRTMREAIIAMKKAGSDPWWRRLLHRVTNRGT